MHNVRLNSIQAKIDEIQQDQTAASLDFNFEGIWHTEQDQVQFSGEIAFPQGELTLSADFPTFLGGEGRAPSALTYCFFGALSCYGSTFATQAAMAGVKLDTMTISLKLGVDFRTALGVGDFPPMTGFEFNVKVKSDASDTDIQNIKQLTDERCPAIWAMNNPVPHTTTAELSI